MALPPHLQGSMAIKGVIIFLTIVAIVLTDPGYISAYISINYEIVIIYIVSSLTFLYCIVSILMQCLWYRGIAMDSEEEFRMTNICLTEIVFACAGIIGWSLVCGFDGTVAQRTIIETGQRFGWMGAAAGINAVLFLGLGGIFLSFLLQSKVFSQRRREYKMGAPTEEM